MRWHLLAVFAATLAASRAGEAYLFQQQHMGCLFSLKLVAESHAAASPAAKAAFARIGQLNEKLSDYLPHSEISRWEKELVPGTPQGVTPDVWECLETAQTLWKASDGAFDVTLGNVNGLWREMRRTRVLPEAAVIAAARAKCGFQHLKLDATAKTLTTNLAGLKFDFGGIAKGQALEAAGSVLTRDFGISSYLLDAGGQLAAKGDAPGKSGWTVAIESLPEETVAAVVKLQDTQLATSGDLHQFVEINGTRYSHITDPKTGLGVTTCRQASVLCPNGLHADALATICCIHPPEKALAIVAKFPTAQARILEKTAEGKITEHKTKGWP